MIKKILGVAGILCGLLTATAYADDPSPTDNLLFRPSSPLDGNVYAELNAAYAQLFMSINNDSAAHPTALHLNKSSLNLSTGYGEIELGYKFNKNYSVPIRLALAAEYRFNKRFSTATEYTNNLLLPNEAYEVGHISTAMLLARAYWDIYTNTEFQPYIGVGVGGARNRTDLALQNKKTGHYVIPKGSTVTTSNMAFDVTFGSFMNLAPQWDANLYLRFSSFGKANFASATTVAAGPLPTDPIAGTTIAMNAKSLYSADVGLGIRYTFS